MQDITQPTVTSMCPSESGYGGVHALDKVDLEELCKRGALAGPCPWLS